MTTETLPGCAVVDCPNRGIPQTCPYDGSRHHHGAIHYRNDHPAHPHLRFRDLTENGWMYVCGKHRAEIERGLAALRDSRVSA